MSEYLTTSTIYSTTTYTVDSCPPEVTDCPWSPEKPDVVTRTYAVGTTVCAVTATETETASPSAYLPAGWTTSTVYTTATYTITSCKPEVTDCPAKIGQVTTEVVPAYTTVCPIGGGSDTSVTTVYSTVQKTTTKHLPKPTSSAIETYIPSSVVVIEKTATVVPQPSATPSGYNNGTVSYPPAPQGTEVTPPGGCTGADCGPVIVSGGVKAGVSFGLVALGAVLGLVL